MAVRHHHAKTCTHYASAPRLALCLPAIALFIMGGLCSVQGSEGTGLPSITWFPPDDYTDVGTRFFHAMLANDIRRAHRVAIPSTWDRIDQWMSSRPAFRHCPINWFDLDNWFDRQGQGSVGGWSPAKPDEATFSSFYFCFEVGYQFFISEISLSNRDGEWLVTDWQTPCESYSLESSSDCP